MPPPLTGPEITDILTNTGSKEWNEALSSRLESLRAYLSQDEWEKGISIHCKALMGHAMSRLLGETLTPDASNYLRGWIAALKLVISLPQSIEGEISRADKRSKSGPSGDAGY